MHEVVSGIRCAAADVRGATRFTYEHASRPPADHSAVDGARQP
jgi:hypothetical protein